MKTNVHFWSCLLRKRNISDNGCRAKQNTHFTLKTIFKKSCGLWDNEEKILYSRTIRRMRIVCRIPKATDTHSKYVMLIAFPLQQWLYERASVLRDTRITCLVYFNSIIANTSYTPFPRPIRYWMLWPRRHTACGSMSSAAAVPKKGNRTVLRVAHFLRPVLFVASVLQVWVPSSTVSGLGTVIDSVWFGYRHLLCLV
jgi:hypothetical protein